MKNPETNELLLKAVRGELSVQEEQEWQRQLQADTTLNSRFQDERNLEAILRHLPDAPVSSNFTSLVMQAVEQETCEASHSRTRFPWLHGTFLRFASARVAVGLAVVLLVGLVTLQQYRRAERADMAQTVSQFAEVAPSVEIFQDFDVIQRLSLPPEGELDMDLLVALQK